jgi:hypothetical protein
LLIDLRLSFTSIRTAYTNELSLDKEQTSYDDLLDALRLSLKGYQVYNLVIQVSKRIIPIFLNLILVLKSFYTKSKLYTLLLKYVYIPHVLYFFLNS